MTPSPLDELRRLNRARTSGEWQYRRFEYDGSYYCTTPDVGCKLQAQIDGEFLAFATVLMDKLLAVCDAAENFHASFGTHYHGYPGKLEWP